MWRALSIGALAAVVWLAALAIGVLLAWLANPGGWRHDDK